jgi:hypothetical protein
MDYIVKGKVVFDAIGDIREFIFFLCGNGISIFDEENKKLYSQKDARVYLEKLFRRSGSFSVKMLIRGRLVKVIFCDFGCDGCCDVTISSVEDADRHMDLVKDLCFLSEKNNLLFYIKSFAWMFDYYKVSELEASTIL